MIPKINLTIHDEPLVIEVMGVERQRLPEFDPVEIDKTGYTAIREMVIGNITIRIYEP